MTDTIAILSEVVLETNNLGVHYLNNGDLVRAKEMLFESIRIAKKAVRELLPQTTTLDMTSSSFRNYQSLLRSAQCEVLKYSSSMSFLGITSSSSSSSSGDEEYGDPAATTRRIGAGAHIHLEGIHIDPYFSLRDGGYSLSFCTAIILFNIALVEHRGALMMSTTLFSLRKARLIYEQCHAILLSCGVGSSLSGGRWTGIVRIDILYMVLLNNLGHICIEEADYIHSRSYYSQLIQVTASSSSSDMMLTTNAVHYGNTRLDSFMRQQRGLFFLNALHLGHLSTSAAAA